MQLLSEPWNLLFPGDPESPGLYLLILGTQREEGGIAVVLLSCLGLQDIFEDSLNKGETSQICIYGAEKDPGLLLTPCGC